MVSIYTYRCVLCAGTWFPLALGILGKILGVSDGTSCIKINSMSLKWSNAFEVCTPAGRESQRWRSKSSTVVFGRPGESTPSREFGRGSSFKNGFSTCVYCKHITTLKIWGCIQNYPSNCLITNVCIIVLITCCHKITTGYFHTVYKYYPLSYGIQVVVVFSRNVSLLVPKVHGSVCIVPVYTGGSQWQVFVISLFIYEVGYKQSHFGFFQRVRVLTRAFFLSGPWQNWSCLW